MEQTSTGRGPAAQRRRGRGEGPDPVEVKDQGQGDSCTVGAGGHTAPGLLFSPPLDSPRFHPHHTADPAGSLPPFHLPGLPQATRCKITPCA